MIKKSHTSIIIYLIIILLSIVFFSVSKGALSLDWKDLFCNRLSSEQNFILYSVRIPRTLLALIIGGGLAVSGCVLQGLFNNSLVEPGLLGVSGGASLFVAISIVFLGSTINILGVYTLSTVAFVGAFSCCFLVLQFARLSSETSLAPVLLAGIAINSIVVSVVGLLTYISNNDQLRSMTLWSMGSFNRASWHDVIISIFVVLPISITLYLNAQKINILSLGQLEAQSLGVNTSKIKYLIIVCSALIVGVSVAVSGIIGFVGLVVPHLVRLIIGPDYRFLIFYSFLFGAILLLCADFISRVMFLPAEVPVGIITSLIGGPFFIWLLIKQS